MRFIGVIRDLKKEDRYFRAWNDYRIKEILVWTFGLAYVPMNMALQEIEHKYRGHVYLSRWIALLWLAGVAVLLLLVYSWHCPRCGRRFFGLNLGRTKCAHCGLPKWAPDDPDKAKQAVGGPSPAIPPTSPP